MRRRRRLHGVGIIYALCTLVGSAHDNFWNYEASSVNSRCTCIYGQVVLSGMQAVRRRDEGRRSQQVTDENTNTLQGSRPRGRYALFRRVGTPMKDFTRGRALEGLCSTTVEREKRKMGNCLYSARTIYFCTPVSIGFLTSWIGVCPSGVPGIVLTRP